MVESSFVIDAQQTNRDRIEADQIIGFTCSCSDYDLFGAIPEARQDSEMMKVLFESDMHLPATRRFCLHNPQKTDFKNVLYSVMGLALNGKNTLLFFHYAGHGVCNGGHVGLFGDSCFVNF